VTDLDTKLLFTLWSLESQARFSRETAVTKMALVVIYVDVICL